MQNKLHWTLLGQMAAEVIYERADAAQESMGLTSWKDALGGKIQEFDVVVGKNHLIELEMAEREGLVSRVWTWRRVWRCVKCP